MRLTGIWVLSILLIRPALSQHARFTFGTSYRELNMKIYARDSLAEAVYLDEFGSIFFDDVSYDKVYLQYRAKIKILKEEGKKYADFVIPLYKKGSREEVVRNIKASVFNLEGNKIQENALQNEWIFREKADENIYLTKFSVSNVRVGSVIEVYWEFESPFIYNLVPIRFQTSIPKVNSEFWVNYPAYYQYNASLKGFLPLTKKEASVVRDCAFLSGSTAICYSFKYGMKDVPAFREEAFMTARENFEAAIKFELEQINYPGGEVKKVTTDWQSAEQELAKHPDFGIQIKSARNLFGNDIQSISKETDLLSRARQIFDLVKNHFTWNGELSKFSRNGVKKAVEEGKGNAAEINLALCGALQESGLNAEPVLISTRENGMPITAYPVVSDFNYVIVRLEVGGEIFLLDATNRLNPFGFVDEQCLNGSGRAVGATSSWIDIKPSGSFRQIFDSRLSLSESGNLSGRYTITSQGYAARRKRIQFFESAGKEDFIKKRIEPWSDIRVLSTLIENEADLSKDFIEKYEIEIEGDMPSANLILFNRFLTDRMEKNPFTANDRQYPVDFGAPYEETYVQVVELPENYVIDEMPSRVGLTLPGGGGHFAFNLTQQERKLTMVSRFSINKTIFLPAEYHALRELYAKYVSVMQSTIVLKRK